MRNEARLIRPGFARSRFCVAVLVRAVDAIPAHLAVAVTHAVSPVEPAIAAIATNVPAIVSPRVSIAPELTSIVTRTAKVTSHAVAAQFAPIRSKVAVFGLEIAAIRAKIARIPPYLAGPARSRG